MENKENQAEKDLPKKRSVVSSIIVGALGAVSAVYLLNPTMGFLELIPDNLPIVGNLDEAAAATLLISCLAYFGLDIGALFGKAGKSPATKSTGEDVIDV